MTATAQTLLQKALAVGPNAKPYGPDYNEFLDVVVAYAQRKITGTQAAHALGTKTSANALRRMSSRLMTAVRAGRIRIEKVD